MGDQLGNTPEIPQSRPKAKESSVEKAEVLVDPKAAKLLKEFEVDYDQQRQVFSIGGSEAIDLDKDTEKVRIYISPNDPRVLVFEVTDKIINGKRLNNKIELRKEGGLLSVKFNEYQTTEGGEKISDGSVFEKKYPLLKKLRDFDNKYRPDLQILDVKDVNGEDLLSSEKLQGIKDALRKLVNIPPNFKIGIYPERSSGSAIFADENGEFIVFEITSTAENGKKMRLTLDLKTGIILR